jgi:predicted methyltransferase
VFGKVKLLQFAPPEHVNMGADGSVDMVLTFRNLHDWLNVSASELDSIFQAAIRVLKPGWHLRHRRASRAAVYGRGGELQDPAPHSRELCHRARPQERLRAGRYLAVNANPKDDETRNVHELLPELAGGESLRAIGESDRMTLKFVKPSAMNGRIAGVCLPVVAA